jgi:uncharacterized Zn finger protein
MSPAGRAAKSVWQKLTWNDVAQWAGAPTAERGAAYRDRVRDLAVTADGNLLAWVEGERRYATLVEASGRRLHSQCTCPIGSACKHSVAVVLSYLDLARQGKSAAAAGDDDPRWDALQASRFKYRDFEDEESQDKAARLRELLQAAPPDELLEFTMGLLDQLPDVADQLLHVLDGTGEQS